MEIELRYRNLKESDIEILSEFQCREKPAVERFLKEEAIEFQNLNLTNTRLYFDNEDNLVGYYSLFNDKRKRKKHRWNDFPSKLKRGYGAARLHFMGIDSRFQKRGYGDYLMIEVIETCKEIADMSGCAFIFLEAYRDVVEFYKKYKVIRFDIDGDYMRMILRFSEFY